MHRLFFLTGIALPFAMGCGISKLLYKELLIVTLGYDNVDFTSFMIFMGVSGCAQWNREGQIYICFFRTVDFVIQPSEFYALCRSA